MLRFCSPGGPGIVRMVMPEYPREARRLGKDGTVVLKLSLDAAGKVEAVEVLEGAGYGMDYEILDESVSGDRATVTVNYSMSSGGNVQSGENSVVPLVKIKGRWYLSMS